MNELLIGGGGGRGERSGSVTLELASTATRAARSLQHCNIETLGIGNGNETNRRQCRAWNLVRE